MKKYFKIKLNYNNSFLRECKVPVCKEDYSKKQLLAINEYKHFFDYYKYGSNSLSSLYKDLVINDCLYDFNFSFVGYKCESSLFKVTLDDINPFSFKIKFFNEIVFVDNKDDELIIMNNDLFEYEIFYDTNEYYNNIDLSFYSACCILYILETHNMPYLFFE